MAAAIQKIPREIPMEERITWLESQNEHLLEERRRIETQIDKVDTTLSGRLDQLERKIDAVKEALAQLATSRMADRVWQLLISAAMLGVMARGFKWI